MSEKIQNLKKLGNEIEKIFEKYKNYHGVLDINHKANIEESNIVALIDSFVLVYSNFDLDSEILEATYGLSELFKNAVSYISVILETVCVDIDLIDKYSDLIEFLIVCSGYYDLEPNQTDTSFDHIKRRYLALKNKS
jgi:hypothetical protein